MTHVIPGPGRLVPLMVAAALGLTLITSCSSGTSVPDPSTVAQVRTRLLAPGTAPGFSPQPAAQQIVQRSARARPFVPPRGTVNHVCSQLAAPTSFVPGAVLSGGQSIGTTHPQLYGPFAPSWFEGIDVYPGTEAAAMVTKLTALIGKCAHFLMAAVAGSAPVPASEAAASLSGLGDQALYVTVRARTPTSGLFQAHDWIVIRSDRTLIWIDDQSIAAEAVGKGHDQLTLRLAQDAWRHFSAG
jgi:hypothetical protein